MDIQYSVQSVFNAVLCNFQRLGVPNKAITKWSNFLTSWPLQNPQQSCIFSALQGWTLEEGSYFWYMSLLNPKICHLQRWVDILRVMLFYYTQGSHGAALLRLYLRHHHLTCFFFFWGSIWSWFEWPSWSTPIAPHPGFAGSREFTLTGSPVERIRNWGKEME